MLSSNHESAARALAQILEQQNLAKNFDAEREDRRKMEQAQAAAVKAARDAQLSAAMPRVERIIEETSHRLKTRLDDGYVFAMILAPSEVRTDSDDFIHVAVEAIAASYVEKFFQSAGRVVKVSKEMRSWGPPEYEMRVR